jgi:hypothetical protein
LEIRGYQSFNSLQQQHLVMLISAFNLFYLFLETQGNFMEIAWEGKMVCQ